MTGYQDEAVQILNGDAIEMLKTLPDNYAQTVVTSPPYWGLRNYKADGQIGLEPSIDEHIKVLVKVFGEVKRVLRTNGTLWVNYGDAYAGSWGAQGRGDKRSEINGRSAMYRNSIEAHPKRRQTGSLEKTGGCKAKDLMGLAWMLAFALRADGWYLRSDIIWSKPNPMPESVTDRPTKAHEYLFLLSKSERYFYDAEAIKEEGTMAGFKMPEGWDTSVGNGGHGTVHQRGRGNLKELPETQSNLRRLRDKQRGHSRRHDGFNKRWDAMSTVEQCSLRVNKRTVWEIPTQPYPEAHFATFPEKLVEPCILAGSRFGDVVLDPFAGSATTLAVAKRLGRKAVGIELNPDYVQLGIKRCGSVTRSLF